MYRSQTNKQIFKLTPIAIMLASSVFMLFYSLFGMMDINNIMLEAIRKQESSNVIHSDIYTGITQRYFVLFKIVKGDGEDKQGVDKLLSEITALREELLEKQLVCIHNKVDPINAIFIKQAEELLTYKGIEEKVLTLFHQNKIEEAFALCTTALLKQKEATLNQIVIGKNYISEASNKSVKDMSNRISTGIIFYASLSSILILLSLYFSVRILRKYISRNKAFVDSTKLDLLTNLSNRSHLLEQINEEIIDFPSSEFAIVFIDIDYFKSINDIYGHTLADSLLIEFGKRLSSQLIGLDYCLARFGGDEFVLLIKKTNKDKVDILMARISKAVNSSYYAQNKNIGLTSSIGVSMYPKDANTIEMLLHNSDLAMYQAKKDGRACYRFFSKKLKSAILIENETSHRLQTSLSNKESIFLLYQPLFNTTTCSVSECEALLRWDDSKLGNVSPATFIPIAEKTNLIKAVNYFVIDEACEQQSKWVKAGVNKMRININLAGNQDIFTSSLKRLMKNIKSFGLLPSLFGIEITERSLFEINDETVEQLRIVNQMGIKISIDDFGTGYSSLLYLAKLPLTTLKIDKVFISNICNKEKDNAIILSIIKLGHALGLDIVAEGVETLSQCDYLKAHSCNVIQGYLFSKPVTPDELVSLDVHIMDD